MAKIKKTNFDGFVKSPSVPYFAGLGCILFHCGGLVGARCFVPLQGLPALHLMPFYEIINFHFSMKFCGPFQNAKLIQKAKL